MLYNSQPQAGPAAFSAARLIYAVESLEDTLQVDWLNAATSIGHADNDFTPLA